VGCAAGACCGCPAAAAPRIPAARCRALTLARSRTRNTSIRFRLCTSAAYCLPVSHDTAEDDCSCGRTRSSAQAPPLSGPVSHLLMLIPLSEMQGADKSPPSERATRNSHSRNIRPRKTFGGHEETQHGRSALVKRTLSVIAIAAGTLFGISAANAAPLSPASTSASGVQSIIEKTGDDCHGERHRHRRSARVIRSERIYRSGPAVRVHVDRDRRYYRRHHRHDRHMHRHHRHDHRR
jgi:hypothetical protein